MTVPTAAEVRPVSSCSPEQMADLFAAGGWPPFIDADAEAAAVLPRVRERFTADELAVVEDDRVLAAGWGVPLRWDGSAEDLPSGYTDTLHRAVRDRDLGSRPDTFVLCAIQVRPGERGLAARLITALTEHAERTGHGKVVAPLRPTLKHRYPLTPIADYATWVRDDGTPFDPWLRLHVRLGARVVGIAEASQTFTGTVAQWQDWGGLALPAGGRYVVPDALAPLTLDTAADRGVCVEPGIWVQHRPDRHN